ncbi:MAG TPA: MYXO-CTERM sorting domain-containing protein [Kofleriaceae bacterium]|jgi:uncharacterized protein (TIGR03382 family)
MAPPALPPTTVTGDVVAVHSFWTADHSRIVTESTIRADDGSTMTVSQLGGSVDGVAMRQFPGPEILSVGLTVSLATHAEPDLSLQMHQTVDDLRILARPDDFVRSGPTKQGTSLYWASGCIYVTVDSDGTREIAGSDEFPLVDQCIDTWNTDIASCSYMQVMNAGSASVEVGADYTNVIKFRDTSWCRPAIGDDPARCYGATAAGITTALYVDDANSDRDGEILDADIEINGVNFAISNDGVSLATGCLAELKNTLTHELGHLHGLEHPCLADGDPPRVDNTGSAVPSCDSDAGEVPAITEVTMYNFQDCGETKKESLETDDIQGACTIAPLAKDPHACDMVEPTTGSGGCCDAGGASGPTAVLGALAVVLGRRRKISRRE